MNKSQVFKQKLMGLIFLIPGLFFLGVFMIYPVVYSMIMSFTNWTGFNDDYSFIGAKNYITLFTATPDYWQAMGVNLYFAVVSTLIQTVLGFLLAYMVYNLTARWQNFYKVSLYLPVVLPAAVVAVMWRFILAADSGLINQLLRAVGLDSLTHAWVGEKETALWAVILVNTWQFVGFTMVLYYISMQNVSKDILESASIDGANGWQKAALFLPSSDSGHDGNQYHLLHHRRYEILRPVLYAHGRRPGTATRVVSLVILQPRLCRL